MIIMKENEKIKLTNKQISIHEFNDTIQLLICVKKRELGIWMINNDIIQENEIVKFSNVQ